MAKTSTDPIFEAYRRTAPLEDLRFYLRYARRKLATHDLPDRAVGVVGEMAALESELAGRPDTSSMRGRVWALIDRFKASMPNWHGNAGAANSWVGPAESDQVYFCVRAQAVLTTVTTEGGEVEVDAAGPITIDEVQRWHAEATSSRARYEPPVRLQSIAPEEVDRIIDAARPAATTVPPTSGRPTPKRSTAAAPILPCPRCAASLESVGQTWRCSSCSETWRLTSVSTPITTPRTVATPRKPVDWAAAGRKAWETRQRNLAARAATPANTSHLEKSA